MSVENLIKEEVIDHYQEHELHIEPDSQCSTCWEVLRNHTCPTSKDSELCELCELYANTKTEVTNANETRSSEE